MALSPEYLQGLPEELENLTMQFEADIIADISRRIAKAGSITDTAEYQMMILKEMGASTEYLEKRISEYTGYSEELVRQMIFDAAQTDSDFYESVYARANRPYVPFEYNEYLQGLAVAAVNQTCGELTNFTRTMGFSARGTDGRIYFKSCADTYRAAMDKAHTLVVYGGADYMTAVRMATKEITAAGLQFVDYASGVRNHADVAVRRALLTGVSQMTGKVSERNAEQLDTDVVEVSAHAGARPDHAVWQGKWFSLKGKDKRYPLLAAATGYGSVTGLKGANCRHDFYPVIPGIDEPAYTAEQLRHIDPPPVTIDGKTYTYYEAEQRQRAFERAIRKTKREIIAADASHDEEMFTAKSVLLRRQKEAYGEFSKQAGLLPRIERTGVAEYGRSISAKAVWADRKANISAAAGLTNGAVSDTIERAIKARDFKSVSKYVKRDMALSIDSLSELPAENLKTVVSALHSLNREFPSLSGFIDAVDLTDIGEIAKASIVFSGDKPKVTLKLSKQFFTDYSVTEMNEIIKELSVANEFAGKQSVYDILKHEYVHFVEYQKTLLKYGDDYAASSSSLDRFELCDSIQKTVFKNLGLEHNEQVIEHYVSTYATVNSAEFVAEAYSSNDDNIIVNELKRVLKKKWRL